MERGAFGRKTPVMTTSGDVRDALAIDAAGLPDPAAALGLQRGEEAEVRGLAEIRATLDAGGMLDGMPFMPEMERFAGRRARVWRRADRVCVEGSPTQRRLRDTVFLEDLRCDGAAHAGCQRACLLLWNEAWLRRPGAGTPKPAPPAPLNAAPPPPPARNRNRFFCQSTALLMASTALPAWRPEQYLRDLATGNLTPGELVRSFAGNLRAKFETLVSRRIRESRSSRTPSESLRLAVGDWVEVKSLSEIKATLNARRMNRGLAFTPGMRNYCGGRFRVARRLERMVREATGEMRGLTDTVVLESVLCDGFCTRGCPRANLLYWREIWLRRAPAPSNPPP